MRVLDFLRSDSPSSSMRLSSIVWSIGGFIVWATLCLVSVFKSSSSESIKLVEIPSNILVLISASWTAQVTQKIFGEDRISKPTMDQIGSKGEEK